MNVQILLNELSRNSAIHIAVVNTSPSSYRKKTGLLKLDTLDRGVKIINEYRQSIKNSDAVLVIATSSFIFTLGSLLLLLARQSSIPIFLKPLGADLSYLLKNKRKLVRSYILMILHSATGVLVQTQYLQKELGDLGCTNIHYLPGYRPVLPDAFSSKRKSSKELRLVFLSQIAHEKGPLLLLEALRTLSSESDFNVSCDFYGPVLEEDRIEFFNQLERTHSAKYCGLAEIGKASQIMAEYDALVFPTYWSGEGHPGVIIEAMLAGIPIISSQFQAATELIIDGENGLLFPPGDSCALVAAIKHLTLDQRLRQKMAKSNRIKGQEFRSDKIVLKMLEIIFPNCANLLNI